MADFTSSLYLGLQHPSSSVPPWQRLTTGAPAALVEAGAAVRLAQALAALVGGERAVLMPSTLHVFVDLLASGLPGSALFWDRALYPVAMWGIELAAARGVPTARLPHLADEVDEDWLMRRTPPGHRPVIVTDGFCIGCGRAAPLRRLVDLVQRLGGLVVIDDTQALGLFGRGASAAAPFGLGGGGSMRRQALEGAPIVVAASLAKAFGVPLAVATGPAPLIAAFAARSPVRVHSSPPAAPLLHAARAALDHLAGHGDDLRLRLANHIAAFARGTAALGFPAQGGLFPVQSLDLGDSGPAGGDQTVVVQERLGRLGVRSVVTRAGCRRRRVLTFLIRADHRRVQIAHALDALRVSLHHRATRPSLRPFATVPEQPTGETP